MLKDSNQQYAIITCIGPVAKSIYWHRSKLYVYPAKSLGWITVGHPSSVLIFHLGTISLACQYLFFLVWQRAVSGKPHTINIYRLLKFSHKKCDFPITRYSFSKPIGRNHHQRFYDIYYVKKPFKTAMSIENFYWKTKVRTVKHTPTVR